MQKNQLFESILDKKPLKEGKDLFYVIEELDDNGYYGEACYGNDGAFIAKDSECEEGVMGDSTAVHPMPRERAAALGGLMAAVSHSGMEAFDWSKIQSIDDINNVTADDFDTDTFGNLEKLKPEAIKAAHKLMANPKEPVSCRSSGYDSLWVHLSGYIPDYYPDEDDEEDW